MTLPTKITISGQAGAGNSTVAKLLAKKTGHQHISSNQIARKMFPVGRLEQEMFANKEVFTRPDRELVKRAKNKKKQILEGKITGWMAKRYNIPAFKVFLKADFNTRAKRTVKKDRQSLAQAKQMIRSRTINFNKAVKKHYGIDRNDLSIYNIVINTSNKTPKQIVDLIIQGAGKNF